MDNSLTKSGAGTLVLTGTSTYTGAAHMVSDGTLEVDGSIASSSGVGVADGADLSGSGSVPGVNAAAGSTLQPGSAANPAGTAILSSGNINLATGSTFDVYLGGTAVGTGYDQHNVTGTMDLDSDSGGGATLVLTLAFTPTVGDSFVIVANDGTDPIQGTFDGLPEGSTLTVGSQQFQITYAGGPGGNEVVVTCKAPPTVTVTAAPNPSQLGQGATFSVTVSGSWLTPTGTVTFYDGNPGSGGQPIGTAPDAQRLRQGQRLDQLADDRRPPDLRGLLGQLDLLPADQLTLPAARASPRTSRRRASPRTRRPPPMATGSPHRAWSPRTSAASRPAPWTSSTARRRSARCPSAASASRHS